jgi:hypothetical protein
MLKINYDADTKLEILEKEFNEYSSIPKPINEKKIDLKFLVLGNLLFSTKAIEKNEFDLLRQKMNIASEKYIFELLDLITNMPDIDNSVIEMLKLYFSKLFEYQLPEEKNEIQLIEPNKGYI